VAQIKESEKENNMQSSAVEAPAPAPSFTADFWQFWAGQSVSNLGTAFTQVALPLLVYKLTGSAVSLALGIVSTFLPYLLFGLVIGAWIDRTNRKRFMIVADLGRALLIGSIPLLYELGLISASIPSSIWYIYVVMFLVSTLGIGFVAAQMAALPNLVDRSNLVAANGRFQTSFSIAQLAGPVLAGGLLTIVADPTAPLVVDAISFLVSVVTLLMIRASFDPKEKQPPKSIRQDIAEGLRYVFGHPVLRSISLMLLFIIFIGSTIDAQIVLFVKEHFKGSDAQVALFFTAGGVGFLVVSLIAATLRKFTNFSTAILGAAILKGALTALLGLTPWYWAGLVIWAMMAGLTMFFNINTLSLRQTIAPSHMLGRVITIGQVIAWSMIPLGTFIGGVVIDQTKNVSLVYTAIGLLTILIAFVFLFSPLSHIDRYLAEQKEEEPAQQMEQAHA